MTTTEQDLAGVVVAWLQRERWDVYQEVAMGVRAGGDRADIVAVRGPVLWVVECKRKMGMAVLGQALNWRRYAHYVSIAVEPAKRDHGRAFADRVMSDYGIGWLAVSFDHVAQQRAPSLRRRIDGRLREALREEHKTFAPAGNAAGSYWSPFQATCRALRKYVKAHEGCTLKEAIDGIKHHYATDSSARGSLRTWVEKGVVDGVRMDTGARPWRLYTTDSKERAA